PARENDPENTYRRNRQDVKNADVDIRYIERYLFAEDIHRRPKWNHRKYDEGWNQANDWSQHENPFVGLSGNDVLLQEQLDGISNRLKQPPRTHAHRSQPDLHERDHLTFGQRHSRDDKWKNPHDNGDLDNRN